MVKISLEDCCGPVGIYKSHSGMRDGSTQYTDVSALFGKQATR